MGLDELVDHFIVRDSESNIQLPSSDSINLSNFTHQSSMIAGEIPSQKTAGAVPTKLMKGVTSKGGP